MFEVSGKGWQGQLYEDDLIHARGVVDGYAWYFRVGSSAWSMEIADGQGIQSSDLPLVGFGTGGWLFEESGDLALNVDVLNTDIPNIKAITHAITLTISLFRDNKLEYVPAVTSHC